jgi:DNA-directed RNA polymerase subunit omega
MSEPIRNNLHCTIPDDPDQSTYRFIIVAAKRARQLQGGQRPVLPTSSKKPTVIAMEEARRGLVKYETNIHPVILDTLPGEHEG